MHLNKLFLAAILAVLSFTPWGSTGHAQNLNGLGLEEVPGYRIAKSTSPAGSELPFVASNIETAEGEIDTSVPDGVKIFVGSKDEVEKEMNAWYKANKGKLVTMSEPQLTVYLNADKKPELAVAVYYVVPKK